MKNFWKKYKVGVVSGIYFLILGIFIYGGIFTLVKQIKNEADEIQKKIIDNEIDNKNLAKIPQLTGDYEIFSAQEKNLDVILQKESEIEFIQSLENLAKETGNEISLKLIEEESAQAKESQKKPTKAKGKEEEDIRSKLPFENYIAIQLELKGGYPELMKFLKKLENMEYYANVISFDLKKEERQEESNLNNPFVSFDTISVTEEKKKEENQPKEILKSLINLVVYIK